MKHQDKVKHFLVCYVIALYQVDVALAAAFAKEYTDHINPHNHWDWYDMLANIAGVILGKLSRELVIHLGFTYYDVILNSINTLM